MPGINMPSPPDFIRKRTLSSLMLISIVLAGCTSEPETPAEMPAKVANDSEATPSNTETSDQDLTETKKPLDLSMPEGFFSEDWNQTDSYRKGPNLFEGKDLFKQNTPTDTVNVSVTPGINYNQDLNELEIDGGSVSIEVKTD
jgi:PBP1b-binding outer membrane lipoprotein LpoB